MKPHDTKVYKTKFSLFSRLFVFVLQIAPKPTVWSFNHQENMREDKLIDVSRVYMRDIKSYSYNLYIGRYMLTYMRFKVVSNSLQKIKVSKLPQCGE